MFAQVFFFLPEQGSTTASKVDALMLFILVLSAFFTVLIASLILYFGIKYRYKPGRKVETGKAGFLKLEITWSIIPLLIGLLVFVWGAEVFMDLRQPPEDAMEIYVIGKQWMWKAQHPGGQREINELHIPVGQPVKLTMISEDVIHDFFVPAFRTKQDVLPNRFSTLWFEASKPGEYHLFCAEFCGTDHSRMKGKVIALSQDDYAAWLMSKSDGSVAVEGRKLFLQLKCIACHSTDRQSYAPLLENVANKPVRLNNETTVIADRKYLRESILNPGAKVVAGFQPVMPSFKGQVSEDDILKLITFIESLKTGDTPPRVEQTPPPFKKEP